MADVMNSGYVNPTSLGQFFKQFKQEKGIDANVMFWQYLNDDTGSICRTVLDTAGADWRNYRFINPGSNVAGYQQDQGQGDYTDNLPISGSSYKVPYPIYFGYANGVTSWWGDSMLAGLGVPGYGA